MTPNNVQDSTVIRYSPQPISFYKKLGSAVPGTPTDGAGWNLAFLSWPYELGQPHPSAYPEFFVQLRHTLRVKLDASGVEFGDDSGGSKTIADLLTLPAPRAALLITEFVKKYSGTAHVSLYKAYGDAWLTTISERAKLCQAPDDAPADKVVDLTLAKSALAKFL